MVFMVAKIFQALGMIAAAALPVLMGTLLSACQLPPECDGTSLEAHCAALERECAGLQSRRSIFAPRRDLSQTASEATGLIFGSVAVLSGVSCVTVLRESGLALSRKATGRGRCDSGAPLLEGPAEVEKPRKLDEILPGFLAMMQNRPFRVSWWRFGRGNSMEIAWGFMCSRAFK